MRRDDVEHALDALASEVPAPNADASSLIARGRRRVVRQRLVVIGIAIVVVATAAGVGAVANNDPETRVVAPVPTTTPGVGPSAEIAVASSLEAWRCVDPLQYTNDGGRTWREVIAPENAVGTPTLCTAIAGGNAWAVQETDDPRRPDILRVRRGTEAAIIPFPRLPADARLDRPTFVDADHGWVLAVYGATAREDLYRTRDGGKTWTVVAEQQLLGYGQVFTSATRGWARSRDKVLTTLDGGATWRAVTLPAAPHIAGFKLDVYDITARGRSVVVYRTNRNSHVAKPFFDVSNDAGRTWSQRPGPELPGNVDTQFETVDALRWRLFSDALWITDDGGRTWRSQSDLHGKVRVRAVSFPTADVGWIATATGTILRTTDSGRTWTDVTNGAAPTAPTGQAQPIQMAFVSAKEGWLCSNPLLFTDEAGTNWRNVGYSTQPVIAPSYQQPLCAATLGGDAWVLTATKDPRVPQLLHFRRGGESRDDPLPFPRLPDETHIVDLTFADTDHGWAVSEPTAGGATIDLYRTTDGGQSWSIIDHNPPLGIHFTSATNGWGAGARHTTDGGRTWNTADASTPDLPPGILGGLGDTVVTPDAIVVRGSFSGGSIASLYFDVSTDGGRTWTMHTGRLPHESVGTTEAQAFGAVDADHWQLAVSNALYVTADRGDTWSQVAEFAGVQSISSVAFLTPNIGFVSALGTDGATVVLGTTDGGASWTTVDSYNPPQRRPQIAPIPGGIIGCPTRTLVPAGPSIEITRAAIAYVNFSYASVSGVYRANSTQGEFASIFSFNVGSCGPDILDNIWIAYVRGTPNAGPGGSTAGVALALAHYDDGWHVFGRYP